MGESKGLPSYYYPVVPRDALRAAERWPDHLLLRVEPAGVACIIRDASYMKPAVLDGQPVDGLMWTFTAVNPNTGTEVPMEVFERRVDNPELPASGTRVLLGDEARAALSAAHQARAAARV